MKRPSAITKALPYAEVAAFIHALKQNSHISMSVKLAFEFLILTATRASEVIGAQWSEIDREARCWKIPASRSKAGRAHRVPLSTRVLTILDEAAQNRGSEFVFARPLSSTAFVTALRLMQRADITGHGFRSAFRDWVLERTSTPPSATEAALGHSVTDTTQPYRRGDQFEERIPLMEAWAAHCAGKAGEVAIGVGMMKGFHRTTSHRAAAILQAGFLDSKGTYGTGRVWSGVWVANRPLDVNEGISLIDDDGDEHALLMVEIPHDLFAEYEWVEEGKPYRESLIPAARLNACRRPQLVETDALAGGLGEPEAK